MQVNDEWEGDVVYEMQYWPDGANSELASGSGLLLTMQQYALSGGM